MNTLIENDGDVTRVRLIAANSLEKLALTSLAEAATKGQRVVLQTDGANEFVIELAKVNDAKEAGNGA